MTNSIITLEIVNQVLHVLEVEAGFKKESIGYEIQDDGNHLLISISMDDLPDNISADTLKCVGYLVNPLIPTRKGEFSWMVVFTRKGKVFDSYFGGDLNNPDSGL